MILLSFLQVLLRQFFSSGILWGDTFLRHLVLWVGFLGATVATAENKHFTIEFLKKSFPEKTRRALEISIDFFSVVTLFFLSQAAVKFLRDELGSASILFSAGSIEVPAWWLDLIIPSGFILLLVHFAIKTIEDVTALFSRSVSN